MLRFNLCGYKSCRKKVFAVAKDGDGFCEKHTVLICKHYGIDEFWPHYHKVICKEIIKQESYLNKELDINDRNNKRELTPSLEVLIFHEVSKRQVRLG